MYKLSRGQRFAFGIGKFGTAIFMQLVTIAIVYRIQCFIIKIESELISF